MGWLGKSLQVVQSSTVKLLLFAGGVLLVWGTLSPIGTLAWWLQQGSERSGPKNNQRSQKSTSKPLSVQPTSTPVNCYIVYLPGVGDYSANQLTSGEEYFLKALTKQHPHCVAVPDVFPYSASNESLGGQRLLAPMWTAIEQADGWLENVDALIKIRNLWRFALSADDRYGPVYNQGIATAIVDRMNAAHPLAQVQPRPIHIILVGTSGGVQVALGAASYLDRWLNAKITVVSVGGDFAGTVGFEAMNRMYHLQGTQDWIEDLSAVVFPSRWQWTVGSPFNQARQQGRYVEQTIGPQEHDGQRGYFSMNQVKDQPTTYVDLTLKAVNQLPIWSEKTTTSQSDAALHSLIPNPQSLPLNPFSANPTD